MRCENALSSADPDGANAQIDLIGVHWPKISGEPSAEPNGGLVCWRVDLPHG
jgi:hypothetical protein